MPIPGVQTLNRDGTSTDAAGITYVRTLTPNWVGIGMLSASTLVPAAIAGAWSRSSKDAAVAGAVGAAIYLASAVLFGGFGVLGLRGVFVIPVMRPQAPGILDDVRDRRLG
jgi:hypothetical protein